ncbi:MAG: HD domain-containing protein [Phycisphaeraceae bacterium]|nr:HD domain-containing protein [Phycisphaeraceae bacterium]
MAERLSVPQDLLQRVTHAAALHDLGKLDVPDSILKKPGPLTPSEFETIKLHPIRGHEWLLSLGEQDPIVLNFVRHHHERVDGTGYPDGLRGGDIPLGARYFAVVDSFDAMTSKRPYRPSAGRELAPQAIEQLQAGIGSRYCRDCVEAFIDLYRSGQLDWVMEHYNDGACIGAFLGVASLPTGKDGQPRDAA